ncbi:MAG: hypothetical protein ACI4C1_03435 [Lachnospiraceae bacterium]
MDEEKLRYEISNDFGPILDEFGEMVTKINGEQLTEGIAVASRFF